MSDFYKDGTRVRATDPQGECVECIIVGAAMVFGGVVVYKLINTDNLGVFYATHEYIVERLR